MRKSSKLVSIVLVFAMLFQINVFAASSDLPSNDFENTQEYKFISALSLGYSGQKDFVSTMTRAEFVSWFLDLMGLKSADSDAKTNSDKFLGFTNDPDYDENGDWVWKSDEEREEENIKDTATPFKDVTSDHKLWNSIKMAAQLGIMRGSDKYFRPDEAITGNEMIKILVDACGAKVLTGGSYPAGYLTQAKRLKIASGIEKEIGDWPVSYKTALIAVYNALHADIYVEDSYSIDGKTNLKKEKDYTLLEYWYDIKYDEGVVDRTKISGLKDTSGFGDDRLEVNGVKYNCGANDFDLLGMEVRVYYKENGTRNEAVYVAPTDTNNEIIVDFDNITGYDYPNLKYWDGTKSKERYIGTDTNIIYNGKALLDYDDSVFDTKNHCGNIRFVDANGDNKYETVVITKSEIFWIESIDYNKKIIYDKVHDALSTRTDEFTRTNNSVDISGDLAFVYDVDGNELSVDNMLTDAVCFVQRTLPSQGEFAVTVVYGAKTVSGQIEEITKSSDAVVMNGSEYDIMDFVDSSVLEIGTAFDLYLTPDNRIAAVKNKGGLIIGYLIGVGENGGGIKKDYQLKLYEMSSEKVKVFDLADKVVYNKSKNSVEKVVKEPGIYNSQTGKTVRQPIKYSLDAEGKINEILLANYDEHLFYMERVDSWFGYRSFGVLQSSRPVYYVKADAKFIYVPKSDDAPDKNYTRKNFGHNNYYEISFVCKDDVDSAYISAAFYETDKSADDGVSSSASVLLVKDVRKSTDADGNDRIVISAKASTNDTTVAAYDPEIMAKCADLEPGDLFRANLGGSPHQIMAFEKVFDVGTMTLAKTANPSDAWTAQVVYMHGSAYASADGGAIINVLPYNYSISGGVLQKTVAENLPSNRYMIFARKYNIIVYDTNTNTASTGSYLSDILFQESTGEPNNVIVCASWGDPSSMFVYK